MVQRSDMLVVDLARKAVANNLARNRASGLPVTAFDQKSGKIISEGPDGAVQVIDRLRNGRYSQRSNS